MTEEEIKILMKYNKISLVQHILKLKDYIDFLHTELCIVKGSCLNYKVWKEDELLEYLKISGCTETQIAKWFPGLCKEYVMTKEEKSALETVKNWNFHPYKEEAEVDKQQLTEAEQKLIDKILEKEDFE